MLARLGALLVATLVALVACAAVAHAAATAPPGWAPGGSSTSARSQVAADAADMPRGCTANSVLLFRVRGSGEDYGRDRLGRWAATAGAQLIRTGWRVRDMQAIYPAPGVPSVATILARPAAIKDYRDAATESWPDVRRQLVAAHERCARRRILVAGYSLGAIVLRYVVPRLPAAVRRRVDSVDVVADPTADRSVDRALNHPAGQGGRLTRRGLDTWAASKLHVAGFQQTAYPADIAGRAAQYCLERDLVCDMPRRPTVSHLHDLGTVHASYPFSAIGLRAGRTIGTAPGAAAGILDLSTLDGPGNGWMSLPSDPWALNGRYSAVAQTFRPGRSGALKRVTVRLQSCVELSQQVGTSVHLSCTNDLPRPGSVVMTIGGVAADGTPDPAVVLARAAIPAEQVPPLEQAGVQGQPRLDVTFAFAAPARVRAGQQYALTIMPENPGPILPRINYGAALVMADAHPGGEWFYRPPSPTVPWDALSRLGGGASDLAFATYIAP